MDDEREVRPGYLPPRAPGAGAPPRFEAGTPGWAPPAAAAPSAPHAPAAPAPAAPPAPEARQPVFLAQRIESGPRNGLAMTGTILGSISLLLLVLTIGIGYGVCGLLSFAALLCGLTARKQILERGTGRAGQARAAIWVGGIGFALAFAAFVTWSLLEASGYTPADLQLWLEQQLERQRTRPGGGGLREDVEA